MASDAEPLVPLLAALGDLVAWLQAAHVPGVVIGGVAASLLGRPRVTRGVDVLVVLDGAEWMRFLTAGEQFSFAPRRPDVIEFAHKTRILLVQHASSGIDVNIVFGALPFEEEAVAKAVWVDVVGIRLPLPTPEDLIIMKAVAHRPRDLGDIEAVLDAHPRLDTHRVRRWVREFSIALAMPDLLSDLEKVLKKRKNEQ